MSDTFQNFKIDYGPLIYYLKKKGEVVYVGSTICIFNRIGSHLKNKDFDSCVVREVSEEELLLQEAKEILKFKPLYNNNLPSQETFISFKKLKQNLLEYRDDSSFKKRINIKMLKKYTSALKLNKYEFKGVLYVEITNKYIYERLVEIAEMGC